jgi:pro-kumamolisin-like protein
VRVSAEVILVSGGGRSLTRGSTPVTAETVDAFRPDEETKAKVKRAFEERGLTVEDHGVTLTVEGEPQTFERVLGVQLDVNPEAFPGEAVVSVSGEPRVPEEVRDLVEAVAFPKRAHMFDRPPRRGRESHG